MQQSFYLDKKFIKFHPNIAKVFCSLLPCATVIMEVSLDAYDILRIGYNLNYKDEFDGEHPWARLLDSFASLFFVSNCWFFASHYLSVACLFRLTFSASSRK